MSKTLENIKSKVTHIDIDELVTRLKMELKLNEIADETQRANAIILLEYALYDTLLIILDVTHLRKIDDSLYSIWIGMIKDYWYLNRYDKLINPTEEEITNVSSIKEGDTQVNFSNSININGITYSTGTIEFDKNILVEKYKKDLYRHRKLRW